MIGLRQAGMDRNIRDVVAQLDTKLLSTVAGSAQALSQRIDQAAHDSREAIREVVGRVDANLEANRHEAEQAQEVLRRQLAQVQPSVHTVEGSLRTELKQIAAEMSTAIATTSSRAQQVAAQLAAEVQARERAFAQLAVSTTATHEAGAARSQRLEGGLSALSAQMVKESDDASTALVKQTEVVERLADSTSHRLADLRSEWDMRSEQQQSQLNGEIATLKGATDAVVAQLDQGSQLLERELATTRDTLSTVIDAEIRSRQRKEEKMQEDLMKLNEQVSLLEFSAFAQDCWHMLTVYSNLTRVLFRILVVVRAGHGPAF
jgi:hypothetical protein